ncbi:hypothetical protein GY45DRAFT_876241 [Cubamyces sp. BRFM 1775]|nr:hypothetical protein GY45DRAFT_876241 [Cubamyces sp. BRFM 1775]
MADEHFERCVEVNSLLKVRISGGNEEPLPRWWPFICARGPLPLWPRVVGCWSRTS